MHLSMRVPWMDRPWDGKVCDNPRANSSCVLLRNVGPRRDDSFETEQSGVEFDRLDSGRLPCLTERASWLSPTGYQITKNHPYAWNTAVSAAPTAVSVPGWAFEAIPYRWLNRATLADEIGYDRALGFVAAAEDAADRAMGLGWPVAWVMDGGNQRALIDEFFAPVVPEQSLVFTYLKHSPLQETRTDRLLVGAAHITGITPPPMWKADGPAAFPSSMWETVVSHSLRPAAQDAGILLPYQHLVGLADVGTDVSEALAWAPEGRGVAFSYVTEHLTDDAALEALASLARAARALPALGLSVPPPALAWLDAQTARLWKLRGPTPGLAAVLGYLGVEHAHAVAREIVAECDHRDPWEAVEAGFADRAALPDAIRPLIGLTPGRVWASRSEIERDALRLLSGLDVSAAQVAVLMDRRADVPVDLDQLIGNPYLASTCTYGQPEHIPFSTVDRACFPGEGADWEPLVAAMADVTEPQDERRVEALITEVLEAASAAGDTVLPQDEVLAAANERVLARSPQLTTWTLEALGLASAALRSAGAWPIIGVDLDGGPPGLKLARFEYLAEVIRGWITELRSRPRFEPLPDPRAAVDDILRDQGLAADGDLDEAEERARSEKAAGLAELFASPLSVLVGPAGTGKTTLLRALLQCFKGRRVVLLAPTGKARVQLMTKVGGKTVRAFTLASFLSQTDRYVDQRYLVRDQQSVRIDADLVVVDEASMLTEEMLAATLDAFRSIGRLVLVGDPRQLPPIGAGRPFVDLIAALRPDTFAGLHRVARSYVELRVPRRQSALGSGASTEASRRADLELAAWFGEGDLGVDNDHIWTRLADQPDQRTVRYESWNGRAPTEVLLDALTAELDLTAVSGVRHVDGVDAAFALTYGGSREGEYLNWELGAGRHAEDWQILSPTRSRMSGTTEINRHLKRRYRSGDLQLATRSQRKVSTNIPYPIGPEQIVRGDKVMATRNDSYAKSWPSGSGQDYVANGEIGVAIGRFRSGKKRGLKLDVEYSSQPGAQYSYRTSSQEDPGLELAWAVTVHKAQGSEFGLTLLLLPARAAVSRELMYTALTRQRDRVVILHDGTLDNLRELTQPWRSETARRLTDLFAPSRPVVVQPPGGLPPQRVDGRIMHVTTGGIVVKSKNEVIVASILDDLAPARWTYEQQYKGVDGRVFSPDFTVQRADGSLLLWEHLGLMDDPKYARTWAWKKQWYADNGFLPHPERGATGTLMWTDDRGGVDVPAWRTLGNEAIGQFAPRPTRRGPAARGSRPGR